MPASDSSSAHTDRDLSTQQQAPHTGTTTLAHTDSGDSYDVRAKRIADWRTRLHAAVRLEERLQLLAELGLTDNHISQAIPGGSASARSVRRWRSEGVPRGRMAGRWEPIDDLCAIIGFLLSDGTYDEEGITAWLRTRHPELNQERPLSVLGTGNFAAVFAAAERTLGAAEVLTTEPGPLSQPTEAGQRRK